MWKDIAKLIYTTITQDADGFDIETKTETEVCVNVKSVARTEFYSALQSGYKPTIGFEVHSFDFDLTKHMVGNKALYADKVEYEGAIYEIIRTYVKQNEIMELTCS
jgi:SPP1 family predicted phage head-tail adaptor